jgi:membrane protein DedA with SNARE-associated domain
MSFFSLHHLVELLHTYGYSVLAVVVTLESFGLPLPGESLLIAAAIFASTTQQMNIELIVLAAALGAMVGQSGGYAIGRSVGYRLLRRYGDRIGLNSRRLAFGRILFRRHGVKVVIVSRFVALLRTLTALIAGANRMPWLRFLVGNAIGSFAWAALYGFGAYFLGHEAQHIAGPVAIALGLGVIAAIVFGILFLRYHERRLLGRAVRRPISVS